MMSHRSDQIPPPGEQDNGTPTALQRLAALDLEAKRKEVPWRIPCLHPEDQI